MSGSDNKHEATYSPRALEEALAVVHNLRAQLRGVFESDLVGIGFSDVEGRVLDVNASFLRMVGYSLDDFTSGRVGWMDITPPEYLPLDQKAMEELHTFGHTEPIVKEFLRKDGSRVPCCWRANYWTAQSGSSPVS